MVRKRMERKNTLLNAIPGLPSIKVGSSIASLIFGVAIVFLFLYLFTIDPGQKQMWLILMIAMIVFGIIALAITATHRKTYTRRVRRGYYTTSARRAAPREKVVVVKYCNSCGKEIPVKETYCEHCGAKQPSATAKRMKTCIKCGKDIPLKAEYCTHCGAKQTE